MAHENDHHRKSFFSSLIPDAPVKLVLVSFIVAVSSMFQYGYATAYINTAQNNFMNYLNHSVSKRYDVQLDETTSSWIWSAIVQSDLIGAVIGTLLLPFFGEKYGRRWCLLMSILPDALGTCLAAAAIPLMMPTLLGIGRMILSIGAGVSCGAVTLFLQEISPTHIRGFISSFQELAACLTCVLGMVMGLPVVLGAPTRLPYLIALGLVGSCPRLILIFCPDSPKYLLLRKRNVDKARLAIEFYHGKTADMQSVLAELESEGQLEVESIEESGKRKCSNLKLLWTDKHVRKAMILGTVVFLAMVTTGIVPVYEFSTYILEDSGLSRSLAESGTLLMAICNIVSVVVSLFIVERFGRRKLLLLGLCGIILCLSSLSVFNILHQSLGYTWTGYGAMISIILYSIIFSMGPGPICWFITSELVPQHVRSSAQAFTLLCNMFGNLCISFIFFPLFTIVGAYSFVILCIVPTTICTLYLYFELPETRNREITDIVMELKGLKKKIITEKY